MATLQWPSAITQYPWHNSRISWNDVSVFVLRKSLSVTLHSIQIHFKEAQLFFKLFFPRVLTAFLY